MRRFALHWIALAIALWVTDLALPGVAFTGFGALLIGSLVLALVDAVVRPVLVFLTFPFTIVTLGLFLLVVNAFCFALSAWLVPGFVVHGFGAALVGALITGVVAWLVEAVFHEPRHRKG